MMPLFFNATIVPGILSWLYPRYHGHEADARLRRGGPRSRRIWFLASALVVLAVSLLLTTGLRVESNVLKFFPADSKVRRDYQFIADRLTGLYTIELDAVADSQNGSILLKQIEQLGTDLAVRPEVAQVIHYKSIAAALDPIRQSVFVETARASKSSNSSRGSTGT
jgi:predicted RND superfamily exporter protein